MIAYIHDIDPVIFHITESVALRWYGVAYLLGFVVAYFLLKYLSRRDLYCIKENKLSDFITWLALFGVLVGGRLGHYFFYQLPNYGSQGIWEDFLWILAINKGGMASHGGIIGVAVVSFIYALRHKLRWLSVTDGLGIVAPVGIFFGRVANFINGELYGRITTPDSTAGMKFPLEVGENFALREQIFETINTTLSPGTLHTLSQTAPIPHPFDPGATQWICDRVRDTPEIKSIMEASLPDRYPSQLYEALAEGLIIFILLWIIRIKWKSVPAGIISALFCFLYSLGRIVTENYREPDSPMEWGLTRGQYLSLGIIAMGIAFLVGALINRKKTTTNTTPMP